MKPIVKNILSNFFLSIIILITLVYISLKFDNNCFDKYFGKNELLIYLTLINYMFLMVLFFIVSTILILLKNKIPILKNSKQWKVSLLVFVIFIPFFSHSFFMYRESNHFSYNYEVICEKLYKSGDIITGQSLSYMDYQIIRKHILFNDIHINSDNINFEYLDNENYTHFKLSYTLNEIDALNVNTYRREEELYTVSQYVTKKNDLVQITYDEMIIKLDDEIYLDIQE